MFIIVIHNGPGYDDPCETTTIHCASSELPDLVHLGHDSSAADALEKWSDNAHNGDILYCLDSDYIIIKCGDKDPHHPRGPLVSQLVTVQTTGIKVKTLPPPKPPKKMAAKKKR